mmetsp:Transcript_16471/g.33132  ORF Transcript_16471/g.33132 Transcript_16471/m.33132 type:complete len:844 (+) Transcript_16471:155-2686(+)|eukprot:CAMPEP_0171347698 /NCGR_PEP_ID=MMETSP0878-20121228/28644_1 /TAXON_ID=67004 /ORGANISM="Thalassiosira weissflogii, Strain CCMP1336" /LENGTH=843 /DNA_ID=CAMNT_0011851807 /DNA_START=111 /DNA_END=2642 /DNA_ORIENTATION=-
MNHTAMGESPQDASSLANLSRSNPNNLNGTNSPQPAPDVTSGRETTALSSHRGVSGTILEAAFVDPAYTWPPADGQGKNAIELQASTALIKSAAPQDAVEEEEISLSPSMMSTDDEAEGVGENEREVREPKFRKKVVTTTREVTTSRGGIFKCCRNSTEQVVESRTIRVDEQGREVSDERRQAMTNNYHRQRHENLQAKQARREERQRRILAKKKKRRREARARERYKRVPEGILIYRLDTSDRTVTLVSGPSSNTDMERLLQQMVVVHAKPSSDKSRRGIILTGSNGETHTLVACEQRTAIAWLESMDMMLAFQSNPASEAALAASGGSRGGFMGGSSVGKARGSNWAKGQESKLSQTEREEIEERYVNLAAYSNNLIRAGAIPSAGSVQKGKHAGGAGGIYYTVTQVREDGEEYDEETLESIAKRRAVIKDSWDFFRMVCSLLRDRRKYDEVFRRMQLDPVYPYLNSMTGLNDPGDDMAMGGNSGADKPLTQMHREEYDDMSNSQIALDLVKRAEFALPSLVEICKALAGSLGMEEVGVGPVKDASAALRKAEKKYEGDVLKVTDFCRALLVVKDFPTLLALLELARDSFGPLIRRVKLSTLKSDRNAKPGGYRDCIINLELKEHICEIQIHLWPMWVVCGVDGFRHYRHCLEYSTDTFGDPFEALAGLDRKTMAELIVMAEEAVADMPLETLEWYHEKFILDYFAETGLFLHHGLNEWAETTLRALIKLRCQSPDIGPDHHETITLYKYLEQALRAQKKVHEADEVAEKIFRNKQMQKTEAVEAEKSLWDQFILEPFESIVDPNKKEREEEERIKKEVRASKKAWRKIRNDRFKFLDGTD